nr:unnamed protein product [Digitaria exilis]
MDTDRYARKLNVLSVQNANVGTPTSSVMLMANGQTAWCRRQRPVAERLRRRRGKGGFPPQQGAVRLTFRVHMDSKRSITPATERGCVIGKAIWGEGEAAKVMLRVEERDAKASFEDGGGQVEHQVEVTL